VRAWLLAAIGAVALRLRADDIDHKQNSEQSHQLYVDRHDPDAACDDGSLAAALTSTQVHAQRDRLSSRIDGCLPSPPCESLRLRAAPRWPAPATAQVVLTGLFGLAAALLARAQVHWQRAVVRSLPATESQHSSADAPTDEGEPAAVEPTVAFQADSIAIWLADSVRALVVRRGRLLIGRAACCHLVVADRHVSRRHCELRAANGVCRIVDLASANGVYVNGVRVRQQDLVDNDRIRVGHQTFRFKSIH
jgi:hypothetical protein